MIWETVGSVVLTSAVTTVVILAIVSAFSGSETEATYLSEYTPIPLLFRRAKNKEETKK